MEEVGHLFRHEAGRITATLIRIFGVRHVDEVEDAVQDALVRALKLWPHQGVPANPSAWLTQVAKNVLVDRIRRAARTTCAGPEAVSAPAEAQFRGEVGDDTLRLLFACCQVDLGEEARVALTLKLAAGFSAAEIARALLAKEAAVAQTLVRAKQRLRDRGAALSIPAGERLPQHLDAVLTVLYLMFNEGYAASRGGDLIRHDLCAEALRLAELLAGHPAVARPQVHALAALFCFQMARSPARTGPDGDLLLLAEQDRDLWDRAMIGRGLTHLRASASGDCVTGYHLEAEIAMHHCLASSFEATDWESLLRCYDHLLERKPTPVVRLNRIVALAFARGAEEALGELTPLLASPKLANYYPLHATHGELLRMTGRREESAEAYRRAANLAAAGPVKRFLEERHQDADR